MIVGIPVLFIGVVGWIGELICGVMGWDEEEKEKALPSGNSDRAT